MVLRADGEVLTGEAAERRALAEPTRTGREFKRRLGDPTPIILGGTPYGAEALLAHLLRGIVRAGHRAAAAGRRPPSRCATRRATAQYKIDLLRQAVRQADVGERDAAHRARGGGGRLRAPGAGRRPARSSRSTTSAAGRSTRRSCARPRPGSSSSASPRGWSGSAASTSTRRSSPGRWPWSGSAAPTLDTDDPATLAALARLREECRRAKEALSSDTDATIQVFLPGLQTEMRLTRAEFEEMIRPRIRETIEALGRAVRSAGLSFDGIDRVLLVGGSSRIPLVAEMVREATGRPVAVDAHPKHTMALGAAFVADQGREAGRRGAGRR